MRKIAGSLFAIVLLALPASAQPAEQKPQIEYVLRVSPQDANVIAQALLNYAMPYVASAPVIDKLMKQIEEQKPKEEPKQ